MEKFSQCVAYQMIHLDEYDDYGGGGIGSGCCSFPIYVRYTLLSLFSPLILVYASFAVLNFASLVYARLFEIKLYYLLSLLLCMVYTISR